MIFAHIDTSGVHGLELCRPGPDRQKSFSTRTVWNVRRPGPARHTLIFKPVLNRQKNFQVSIFMFRKNISSKRIVLLQNG
jgi:hypothetical protein